MCLCYSANAILGTYMQRVLTTNSNSRDIYEAFDARRDARHFRCLLTSIISFSFFL